MFIWPLKPVPDITYNVFSGMLNPTQSINQSVREMLLSYGNLKFFKMVAICHVVFLRSWFLNCGFWVLWRSVKPLHRCGDFWFVKMAAVCHIRFKKFQILLADKVKRGAMHYRTKFHSDLSNCCLVMETLSVGMVERVNVLHCAKYRGSQSNHSWDDDDDDDEWICRVCHK